jgi:hypothetical protein
MYSGNDKYFFHWSIKSGVLGLVRLSTYTIILHLLILCLGLYLLFKISFLMGKGEAIQLQGYSQL